jgi:hypothetical protein
MKRSVPALIALLAAVLACGAPQPDAPAASPPAAQPGVAADLWYRLRGEAKSDQAWGVDVDSEGNVYTAGYYQSPASSLFFDIVVYKFGSDGRELWRTQWGGDLEEKAFIVVVDEPVVYVAGTQHTSAALEEADMAVLALDAESGRVLWSFTWGQGHGYEEVDGLVVEPDAIYVSGWTTGAASSGDIALLKLDRAGALVWARTWGGDGFDSADGQMVVDDEAIYVSGRFGGQNMLLGGQAALVKFDKAAGAYLAHALWGSTFFSDGLGSTSDGTYIYVTGLNIANANGQIFLLKYDKDLDLLWAQEWGGPKGESARVVEAAADGSVLVAGSTESYGAGGSDVVMLKFAPDGTLTWSQTWGGPGRDTVQGLALDGGYAYLVGSSESNGAGMNDALLLKVDARTGRFPPP